MSPSGVSGSGNTPVRSHAVVVGVSHYAHAELPDLPDAAHSARRLAELLTAMGYEVLVSADPTSAQLRAQMGEWSERAQLGPDDVALAYFVGHGFVDDDQHYLLCSDSRPGFLHTAIPSEDLVTGVTDSLAGHTLVVLDACWSGTAGRNTALQAAQTRHAVTRRPGSWVLTSAQDGSHDRAGAFVDVLEEVLTHPYAPAHQRYLGVREVTEQVNASFEMRGSGQRVRAVGVGREGAGPFFPNPLYMPRDAPTTHVDIRNVVRLRQDLDDHFMPRSRGVPHGSDQGDHFVGRTAALTTVAAWLRGESRAPSPLVVTGDPGSGKSALLGRVLALLDPDSSARLNVPPDVLPPTGLVGIPMSCRGATAADVVADLSAALGLRGSDPQILFGALRDRTEPLVVVLDALDEAIESRGIITDVVLPLGALPKVRLLVGTRRMLLAALGEDVQIIDLDAAPYQDEHDLRLYVMRLLADDENTLAALPDLVPAEAFAADVARQAGHSFLVAQLTVRALLQAPLPPGGLQSLPRTAYELFAMYLDRLGPNKDRALRLLLPLAYAQGPGLPRWLWAPLAKALAQEPFGDDDVRWILEQGKVLISQAQGPEGTVYRLYHQTLVEYLLHDDHDGTGRHRAMARCLAQLVPVAASGDRDWAAADPYIRAHVATHAAAGHILDELLRDEGFLGHATPGPLLRALAQTGAIGPGRAPDTRPGPAPEHSEGTRSAEQIVSRILSDHDTVLVVATEWSSAHGGLSTFNRHLCVALAAAGARVFCIVVEADESEIADAAAKDVTLLCHTGAPGAPEYGRLTRRPSLPPGVVPDLIIGHARITGPAAMHLQEDFFPGARRLHIVHMAPDEIEWHKLDDTTDRAARAEERTEIERELGATAHRLLAVGPRLWNRFLTEVGDSCGLEPLQIDPGFDVPHGASAARTPPRGSPLKVLLVGRTEDARLKGVDLAARACGLVHAKASTEPIELVVRGAPPETADSQREEILRWSQTPGLEVVVRAYARERRLLEADLTRASLVIMPSRSEGFGLTGVEAIIRGVPLLVSANSGLANLLRDTLNGELSELAEELIVPVTKQDADDAAEWAARIEKCLNYRESTFARMAAVRSHLAARVTWDAAAKIVLGEVR
ncbi:caspase family protein [Streptomyces sp. NPDC012461]|uniref:caspase family protein n=1 Tax=Streptomyces sp. NPDC012461 TaxID=3155117 RepID=UPI0033D9114C